jgi:hypothetical protein
VEDFVDFLSAKTSRLAAMDRSLSKVPALVAAGAPPLTEDEFRAEGETESDPALQPFLALLARDIENHPETLIALPPSLTERLQALTAGVTVDPDDPIDGDVGL